LCDAVVRALADDDDLRRLEAGGALERLASGAGELAGMSGAEPSVHAVDALRAVIWGALCEELVRPDAHLVGALAERLALVAELVRAAVLRRLTAGEDAGTLRVGDSIARVDELGRGSESVAARSLPESVAPGSRRAMHAVAEAAGTETPDSLWRGALDEEVARAQRSRAKLALLLAELSDADRVSETNPFHAASDTFGRFAQAVRGALRREDILACETENRAWIIARCTGRHGARALASRIAGAVQEAYPGRGAAVTVGIGIAILGEDAHDSAGLIEAADEWSFAAVAAPGEESAEADDQRVKGGAAARGLG
jgi:GGDEF domain-containing protein